MARESPQDSHEVSHACRAACSLLSPGLGWAWAGLACHRAAIRYCCRTYHQLHRSISCPSSPQPPCFNNNTPPKLLLPQLLPDLLLSADA